MATYYPSTTSQIDVLSSSYSEPPLLHGTMMMYLNPVSSSGSYTVISHNPSTNHQNEMMFIPPTSDPMNMQTIGGSLNSGAEQTVGEQNLQSLSLSLSTQMSTAVSSPSFQFQYSNPGLSSVISPHLPLSVENDIRQNKELRSSDCFSYDMNNDGVNTIRFGEVNNPQFGLNAKGVHCNQYQYDQGGLASSILKSKYLKVAKELLDEVVNVRDALRKPEPGKEKIVNKVEEGSKECKDGLEPVSETNESTVGPGSCHELSPAERQELQSKLDKLHSMLDEVDRRYKQYCQQMQLLISSFDMVAGGGAAKPYTVLALKTISRHFRSLRDAITGQIQATRTSLGEQDNGLGAIPRLRYVDQKLRQQRALQQFGMMRHAWRPQRGLPESAVTILRAWLFEHFLHPYPKDSEKIMLARQTGLTRGQVANWFINARVRLWKPMVEEMYKEEFGDAEINARSPENTPKSTRENSWKSEDRKEEFHESAPSMSHDITETKALTSSSTVSALQMGAFASSENHNFYTSGMVSSAVGGYQIPELENFNVDNNNQVSLALGLRQRDGENSFRGNGTDETTMAVGQTEFTYMEQVNQQHRFGNPHILNNFVV